MKQLHMGQKIGIKRFEIVKDLRSILIQLLKSWNLGAVMKE